MTDISGSGEPSIFDAAIALCPQPPVFLPLLANETALRSRARQTLWFYSGSNARTGRYSTPGGCRILTLW
jgi:hypothetical protein